MARPLSIRGEYNRYLPITVEDLLRFAEWVDGSVKGEKLPLDEREISFYQDGEEHRIEWGDIVIKSGDVFLVIKPYIFDKMEKM